MEDCYEDIRNYIEYQIRIGVQDLILTKKEAAPGIKVPSQPAGATRNGWFQKPPVSEVKRNSQADGQSPGERLLAEIREEIGDCKRCPLQERRNAIVFGEGDPNARLMFIGEGPGADEDRWGRPFVGAAGKLLDKMIKAMKLERSQVYIANIVKCRPPNDRTPEPVEIKTCLPFLEKQIEIIKPEAIVALGATSAHTLLETRETITKLRGTFRTRNGIQVMPTFHPSYLLRAEPDRGPKRLVWDDLKQVMALLNPL
jgi:uracil-DNA glycosylase family 4